RSTRGCTASFRRRKESMIESPFRGERLRLARVANALSLAELGERLGVTRQYIHGLEIGAKKPGADTVAALAFTLKVAPSFFARPIIETLQPEECHFRRLKSAPQVARAEKDGATLSVNAS